MTDNARTQWAERFVETFIGLPLVQEFVFRSPQITDRTQREVADFLVLHRGSSILVSQKCQEDPAARDNERTEQWALKKAWEAVSQLRGALRTPPGKPIWAEHPRRGRVVFDDGLPVVKHGLVIIEVFRSVNLEPALPLHYEGVPITYLSVNDFLNLAAELRTVPELLTYLEARRTLPLPELTVIGDERVLYEFYLLNDGAFDGCIGRTDARVAIAARFDRLQEALERKSESDKYSRLLEDVADQLATRNPEFAADLPSDLVATFEPIDDRQAYLRMQEALTDLRLPERDELGRAFNEASEILSSKHTGFNYRTAHFDGRPDWLYVFGASKNEERSVLLKRIQVILRAAMAFYEKPECLVVIDRDGLSYEVAISQPDNPPSIADYENGQRLFGHLRVNSQRLDLVPGG